VKKDIGSWKALIIKAINDTDRSNSNGIMGLARKHMDVVMLSVERARQTWEIEQHPSLTGVKELIQHSNMSLGICDRPSDRNKIRFRAHGGTSGLFGYEHEGIAVCPNCGEDNGYNIIHLLEQCAVLEVVRMECWRRVDEYLTEMGVAHKGINMDTRHDYYLLTMGKGVVEEMVALGLSAESHFAREKGKSSKGHNMHNLKVLRGIFGRTEELLVTMYNITDSNIKSKDLPKTTRIHGERRRVNHYKREAQQIKGLGSTQESVEQE